MQIDDYKQAQKTLVCQLDAGIQITADRSDRQRTAKEINRVVLFVRGKSVATSKTGTGRSWLCYGSWRLQVVFESIARTLPLLFEKRQYALKQLLEIIDKSAMAGNRASYERV